MEGTLGVIGLRREDKSYFERRVALTPENVEYLVSQGLKIIVQPSNLRCYTNDEYLKAGAQINEDLSEASVILGIKEVPIDKLLRNRTYVFFAHVIKAQPYNMPLLDALLQKRIRHIDYERIRSVQPPRNRLVAFGKFAGNAGMIDFLFGLGQFLLMKRIATPFVYQGLSFMYEHLEDSLNMIREIGNMITTRGLPTDILPLVFGITSNGRVTSGVLEILRCLPIIELTPEQYVNYNFPIDEARYNVYVVVFASRSNFVRTTDGGFDSNEFYNNYDGSLYRSVFAERYLGNLSVIIHCMYWDQHIPRILTCEDMRSRPNRLLGICDISCDLMGGIEFCKKFTDPYVPFWIYNKTNERVYDLHENFIEDAILYHSVDFLPSELPRDASKHFGERLTPYMLELAHNDANVSFEANTLCAELRDATITYAGQLTPEYQYIQELRLKEEAEHATKNHISLTTEEKIWRIIHADPNIIQELKGTEFGDSLSDSTKQKLRDIVALFQ